MQARVRVLDPTRLATVAIANDDTHGSATVTAVAGFNYRTQHDGDAYHRARPDTPVLMTEEGATNTTRGVYVDDPAAVHLAAFDRPARPTGASSVEDGWRAVAERPWMAGMFIWSGFDYRGETTPLAWPAISSQFGMLDTTGAFKDTGWYLRSQWTTAPMAHIVGYWNWPGREGQRIRLGVYANGDEAELIANGHSQGRRPVPSNGHAEWQVPYAAGRVEAIGYRAGVPVARDRVETTGTPVRLVQTVTYPLAPGRSTQGRIAVVDIASLDRSGRAVPSAQDDVRFTIAGDARIIGVGNGDPGSHEADRLVDQVTVLPYGRWEIADAPQGAVAADEHAGAWRDPFRCYVPGTGPATPKAFTLRGSLDDGAPPMAGARYVLFLPRLGER